jgi:3'(2'), 5'-bisphosphate nucleotidase
MLDQLSDLMCEVGASLRKWRTTGGSKGFWEGTQFHAKADLWAHEMIHAGLQKISNKYPVVSEEGWGMADRIEQEKYWLVDPIDGTASYMDGFSGYVTQVALMDNAQPVLAVVYAPASDELFVAEQGRGAFKNGNRIPQRTGQPLTLIDNYPEPRGVAADVYGRMPFKKYIESGSLGLKICRVADGTADAFVKDVVVRDWDVAAPQLILTEAGGLLTNCHGVPLDYVGSGSHDGLIATRDHVLASEILSHMNSTPRGSS